MTPIDRLQASLTRLGLKAAEAPLENLLQQVAKKAPGYAKFLDELLGCEVDARRNRYRGSGHRHGDTSPPTPPFDDYQHPWRELPFEGAAESRPFPASPGGNQTSRLSLLRDLAERSSPSRVRCAAQNRRALDRSGPFWQHFLI